MTAKTPLELALECIHCGLCLSSCPTYAELGTETDSPRGRIALVRAMAEGRVDPGGPAAEHLDACLGCRACETACPSSVRYGELLEAARATYTEPARRSGLRRWFWRPLIRQVLVYRRRFALMMAGARLLHRVLQALRISEDRWPALVRRGLALATPRRDPTGERETRRALLASCTAAGTRRTGGGPRGEAGPPVILLEGCVMPTLYPEVNAATWRVLEVAGHRVAAPRKLGCCGALLAHDGDAAGARRMAIRNLRAIEGLEFEAIAVNAAGCGAALKEYAHWLADDPVWGDRARAFASRVRDVSELLFDAQLPPMRELPLRVAYHDPCHLAHGQGIRREPRDLLARIPGVTLVPLPESDFCCGGAGTYALTQSELADRLRDRKVANLRSTGAQVVATGNPSCLLQLAEGARTAGLDVEVLHTVELLACALASD